MNDRSPYRWRQHDRPVLRANSQWLQDHSISGVSRLTLPYPPDKHQRWRSIQTGLSEYFTQQQNSGDRRSTTGRWRCTHEPVRIRRDLIVPGGEKTGELLSNGLRAPPRYSGCFGRWRASGRCLGNTTTLTITHRSPYHTYRALPSRNQAAVQACWKPNCKTSLLRRRQL